MSPRRCLHTHTHTHTRTRTRTHTHTHTHTCIHTHHTHTHACTHARANRENATIRCSTLDPAYTRAAHSPARHHNLKPKPKTQTISPNSSPQNPKPKPQNPQPSAAPLYEPYTLNLNTNLNPKPKHKPKHEPTPYTANRSSKPGKMEGTTIICCAHAGAIMS